MQQALDTDVILLTILVTLTCGIFIWIATPRDEQLHIRQSQYFANFFFLTSISWGLILIRSDAWLEANVFLANLTNFIAFFLLLNGFRLRAGKPPLKLLWLISAAVVFSAIKSIFLAQPEYFVLRLTITYGVWFIVVFAIYSLLVQEEPSKGRIASMVSFIISILFLLITTSLVLAGKSIDFTYLVFCYCIFYVTLFGSISSLMLSDEVAKHQRDALTDGLTGLKNRRFFMEQGSKLLSSARRHDFPMSLILCDIDHFKKINDTFGHSTGDLAIKEITKVLSDSVRHEDMLARFGGEEFIVLLPQTSVKGAAEVAERMRVSTEQKVIKVPNSSIQLTASFGISEVRGQDLEANIICADQALYRAKSNGRNRIEIADID